MQGGVAATLNPLAVILRVEIANAQRAMQRRAWPIRFDVGDEADERGIAFEDHVELAELVAFHPVRALRIDLVPIHVAVDSFNHYARAFQIAKPVLSMRRA